MMTILDRVAGSYGSFRPSNVHEFFALMLARKLGDESAARHYAILISQYSQDSVLLAYRAALRGTGNASIAERFHQVLSTGSHNGHDRASQLLAIKVERRSIGVAVFVGEHLDYAATRQLSSDSAAADASAAGFVNWLLANYTIDSAAIESSSGGEELQRSTLTKIVVQSLRAAVIPVRELVKSQLLESFGHPPLRSRKELRNVILSIWPSALFPNTSALPQAVDAAALGLYVQIERLFIH